MRLTKKGQARDEADQEATRGVPAEPEEGSRQGSQDPPPASVAKEPGAFESKFGCPTCGSLLLELTIRECRHCGCRYYAT